MLISRALILSLNYFYNEILNIKFILNHQPNKHLTLLRLQTLFGRTRLGKTGFQIEGSDLIQFITEDRIGHASGPVQIPCIRYIIVIRYNSV